MKLLIIEDEDDLRSVLRESLQSEGYTVETEGNGKDGLLRAALQDYDLILLDVMLPELNGWEILRRLRAKKDTPVLMLTSQDTPADLIKGLDLGSDDYVTKPFDLDSLKARIRALFRRCSGSASPDITFAPGLTIDTNSRRVSKDGVPIELTAMELNLLDLFLQRRGQILSKDQIAELLFEDCDEGHSNTIEVHIYNLRKKLGRTVLKTRRRLGYELP